MEHQEGLLIICATPIGNWQDMTPRAIDALREADLIAAEDTRHTGQLLSHFGIRGKMVSYHQHNRMAREAMLLEALRDGARVALVSDAGMPCISDPGWELVRAASRQGICVTAIPGASAMLMAVALSGFDMGRFVFEGFLPRTPRERQARLAEIGHEKRAVVLYESPHRVGATLEALCKLHPDRHVAVMRELTKRYEEVLRFTLEEACAAYRGADARGEFVLALAPYEAPREPSDPRRMLEACRNDGMARKDAVVQVAHRCALPRNTVYQLAMEMAWPRPGGT